MNRLAAAGLIAMLASPAYAQTSNQGPVSTIPANPVPAETAPGGALAAPGAAEANQERMRRTQGGGSPADTTSPRRQGQAASDNRAPNPSPQAARQASQAETEYVAAALAGGTVTFQAANFAADKAADARVQRFASFERDEQSTMFDVLHSFADPAATSSTNRPAADATGQGTPRTAGEAASTAPVLPGDASAALERLSRAERGPAFDRAFVDLELDQHQKLLQAHRRYLASSPLDPAAAAVARLAQGRIQQHIAELEAIRRDMR
jgi:hypothetical protein